MTNLPPDGAPWEAEPRTAWRDPAVRAAHVYELVVVTVVFALMVGKPF